MVTESREVFLECGFEVDDGNSQLETLENDFFLRSGGRREESGALRIRGSGGGGRGWSWAGTGAAGVVNAAEASEKDFARTGMLNGFDGAVLWREAVLEIIDGAGDAATRVANDGAIGGSGSFLSLVQYRW